MADTTLSPLTRTERRRLDPRADRDLIAQARERFAWCEEAEQDDREQQLSALKFRAGEHWPPGMMAARGEGQPARLALVLDRLNPYLQQVINAYRRSPLSMRVRPKGGGATKQVAELIEGHLRDIEQQSEADLAYVAALDQACGQGLGYFRLVSEYEDDRSFQQCLRVKPLYNRFAVYVDPASVHPAGLDMEFAFIVDRMSTSRFMQFYEISPQELALCCGPEDHTWRTPAEVLIAEYYYKTYKRETLVQLPDETVLPADGLEDLDPTWPTRETRTPTVHWVKMAGNAVLERTTWLGKYIPVIRCEGQRLDINGRAQRTGMVQAGRDAQMSTDFYATAEAEAIAAAPKAPYIVYAKQISGYERLWNQANDATMPYLLLNAEVVQGQLLPPPRREAVEPPIQAISQAKLMAQQDLQATLGMYPAAVGEPSNEKSGVAIQERKIESDATNYGYSANLAWSIRALGIQCVDLLPKLYSGPTQLRQVSPDGTTKTTPVNQPYTDQQGQPQQHLLAQGQYDVVISTGPTYETSRMQVSEKLGSMIAAVPQTAPYALDKWAASLDFAGSDELAQRFKTLVPPEALAASEQADPQTQLVQLQNTLKQAATQLQGLQQQLQQSQQTEQVATQQVALLERQVADMKVKLDAATQSNEVDMAKARLDYDVAKQKNAIEEQKVYIEAAKVGLAPLPPGAALIPATNGTRE